MTETTAKSLLMQARAKIDVALMNEQLEEIGEPKLAASQHASKLENAREAARLISEFIAKVGGELLTFAGLCLWAGNFLFWWSATP